MKILGTGSYIPGTRITNKELEDRVDTNAKWIDKKLGIRERRIAGIKTSAMGYMAAMKAINKAGISASDLSLIICATSTPDKMNPATASIIQDELKATNATAFDVNAVCSGFVFALILASKFEGNILVIGVDRFSGITDWTSRDCVYFGDGAGAVVVRGGDLKYRWGGDGEGQHAFETEHGGTFKMNGRAVYYAGLKYLPQVINPLIKGIKVDYVIPHQASLNLLSMLATEIGIPFSKFKTNLHKYGNTAAASIPLLLDEYNDEFKKGDNILLVAIGSGWAYGAILIEWE